MRYRRHEVAAVTALVLSTIAPWPGSAQVGPIPPGFQRIFNGRNADGWHWSRTVHHGTTAVAKVTGGVLVLEPHPFGQGGLLLTDRVYKDFELYLEARPDPGYNSKRAVAGDNSYFSTQMVGSKKPNPWGLYDTQGNVWEWVQDYYNDKLFADPVPPRRGCVHVLKGGGFAADVRNAIPATHAAGPGSKFDVGFRVVRDIRP